MGEDEIAGLRRGAAEAEARGWLRRACLAAAGWALALTAALAMLAR